MDAPLKLKLSSRYFFTKGNKASDEYEQFWIRYRPNRILRRHLRPYYKYKNLALVVCIAAYVGLLLKFGIFFIAAQVLVSVIFTLLSVVTKFLTPSHFTLSEDGLQIHWLNTFYNITGPMIGWDRLSHVSIVRPKNIFGTTDPTLEFNVLANGIKPRQRLKYFLLSANMASGWLKGDRCTLRLALDAVASSDDRKRLQMALKKFLPSYRIDASVTDELNLALRVESYTDLWLDALSSSSRIREDMLECGAHILGGKYEVVRRLGGGGQAIVYEAIEKIAAGNGQVNETKVVLKEFVLPSNAGANVRKRVLANIQREAELLKKLNYRNVVKFIDFFVDDQRAYVVLEHIDGITLKTYVDRNGAIPENEAVDLALQMADILKNLHGCNPPIIHRDFTPDNLMMDAQKNLKLIDFNVAEHLEASDTNTVVGKHAFIPPEQFRGKALPQSDIYALGGTLHFLLTAQDPEPISMSDPKLLNSAVSAELNEIVKEATMQEVEKRLQSAQSVRQRLKDLAVSRYGATSP